LIVTVCCQRRACGMLVAASRTATWLQVGWQNHANRRSASELTFGFHAPAVQLRDMLDDRESETGATEFAAARFVSSIEALKNTRQLILAHPDSIVAHAKNDFGTALGCLQANLSVFTRIFHCILQQIVENFLHACL